MPLRRSVEFFFTGTSPSHAVPSCMQMRLSEELYTDYKNTLILRAKSLFVANNNNIVIS